MTKEKKEKTKVLILSKTFPAHHAKSGKETYFADSVRMGNKVHTVRSNYDKWKKAFDSGMNLSIRQWSGKPYHSKQVEIKNIQAGKWSIQPVLFVDGLYNLEVYVDDYISNEGIVNPEILAFNDGLSLEDFEDWFEPELHKNRAFGFDGVIIHFTDFKY